jgi:hypothetical protein
MGWPHLFLVITRHDPTGWYRLTLSFAGHCLSIRTPRILHLLVWRYREARRWMAPRLVAFAWMLLPERLEHSRYWWVLPHETGDY